MKLLAFLIALGLLPWTSRAQAGYEVSGRIAGLADGTRLYLIDSSDRKRIDSATVEQEAFTFRGRVAEPLFAYLYAGRRRASNKLTDFLLDNRQFAITGSRPAYDAISVGGSPDNDALYEYFRQDEQLARARAKVLRSYSVLLARQDTVSSSLKLAAEELQQARIAGLKAAVRRYHDTPVGATLPTMCTLLTSLTAADYTEMYQAISPRWQRTAFGREIRTQIR